MSTPTITTDATASKSATPDMATVEVVAGGDGVTPTIARGVARDLAATIRDSLAEVETDAVRTVRIEVEDTDNIFDVSAEAQYRAREKLEVECPLDSVEDVYLEVTDVGGTVPCITYDVYDEVRRQLEADALTEAVKHAREKANTMADAAEVSLDSIDELTIKEPTSGMEGIVDDALANSIDSNIQPEPIAIQERVEVTYTLSED